MSFVRAHRRFAAWLAMVAMMFSVLAPALAQAMVAATDRQQSVEVCSASGMVWLQADTADGADIESAQDMPTADMNSHCPWCSFHGSGAGFPTADRVVFLQSAWTWFVPFWAGVSPTDSVWHNAQARAPPLVS